MAGFNAILAAESRSYLLIGPGRWGSADPWLGIPVVWQDISGVGAIVEESYRSMSADPSQGSHFFHNITSLGISYFTIFSEDEFIRYRKLAQLPIIEEEQYVAWVRTPRPFVLKVHGGSSKGVIRLGHG